jgi:formylglycine-generating enzyme required for sulfatase activity
LFAILRAERLPLGVEETLRLTHLLALGEGLNRTELEELVACVVARSSEEREACHRALRVWFERESALLEHALRAPAVELVEPIALVETPESPPMPEVEPRSLLAAPDDGAERPASPAPATPPVDRRLWITAAGASVAALLVGALSRPPEGGRSVVPGLATLVLAAITTAALALTTRRRPWLSAPSMVADREAELDLPPPPLVLKAPALLDRRTRDHLVEGVGSYVTEHLTRSLDARRTIQTTVKTAGLPRLVFREARESRTVWLWVDDTARDGLMDRTVKEVHQTLSLEGIRAEVILYRAIPALTGLRALPLTREGFARGPYRRLAADDIDAQRSTGIVALLTDGRELTLAAQGARKRQVHRALAALRGFSRLALVDFGCGKSSLGELSEAHDLSLIRPEQLAAFLSGLRERFEGSELSTPVLERPVMTWAAVCSLSPRPVDEATAHALREHIGLAVTPWSIGALIQASEAGGRVWLPLIDRARLVHWLWSTDLDGLREERPFRRAVRFWRAYFQGNAVDGALLQMWDGAEEADAAAAALWDWSKTPLGKRIELELGDRAPLPEDGGAVRDPGGKMVLPWRLSELAPEARWRLRKLGLGYVERAAAEERLRLPGTAALAIGWSAGIGLGALLSLTGSLVGALGGGAALAIGVYGLVRGVALLGTQGALVEDVGSDTESPPPAPAPREEPNLVKKSEIADAAMLLPKVALDELFGHDPTSLAPNRRPVVSLLEMVEIRGGKFLMGTRDDDPRAPRSEKSLHQVAVGAFWLGKYVVIQEEYEAVTGTSLIRQQGLREPVTHVSWLEATRFCNMLSEREGVEPAYDIEGEQVSWNEEADGYRLPTEAEWEYAARAGTQTAWSFGDDPSKTGAYAWLRENSGGEPHPVGEKLPNRWGLYDMHGNVWEWCWDEFRYHSDGFRSVGDRVLRGGSFLDGPWRLRSADRRRHLPGGRLGDIGFRCARGARRPARSGDR